MCRVIHLGIIQVDNSIQAALGAGPAGFGLNGSSDSGAIRGAPQAARPQTTSKLAQLLQGAFREYDSQMNMNSQHHPIFQRITMISHRYQIHQQAWTKSKAFMVVHLECHLRKILQTATEKSPCTVHPTHHTHLTMHQPNHKRPPAQASSPENPVLSNAYSPLADILIGLVTSNDG